MKPKDTWTIEELMEEPSSEDHTVSSDESRAGGPIGRDEDDEPTEDLLAPELLFQPGSDEEDDDDL